MARYSFNPQTYNTISDRDLSSDRAQRDEVTTGELATQHALAKAKLNVAMWKRNAVHIREEQAKLNLIERHMAIMAEIALAHYLAETAPVILAGR